MGFPNVALGANRNTGGAKNVIYIAEVSDFTTLGQIEPSPTTFATYANPAALPATSTGAQVGDYSFTTSTKQFYKVVGSIGNHVKIYANLSIVEDHVLASGTMGTIEAQYRSPNSESNGSKEYQVTGFDESFIAKVAGNIESNLGTLRDMVAKPLIVLVKDNDGNLIQFGEQSAPCYMLIEKEMLGTEANGFKGSEIMFSCHTKAFYRGATGSLLP